jgi:hemerythrin
MSDLNWSNEYSVSVHSVDKQHQKLFELINQLNDAMRSGVGAALVPVILHNLIAYTRNHFAAEEKLMLKAKYPAYACHKAEHDKLTTEVVQWVGGLEVGCAMTPERLMFLQKWLQNHIQTSDKKYTARMLAAGIC